jgi:hypothetical protein
MHRPKLTRPTVELFSDGEILDVNALNRNGAFRRPMHYPFRRLKTYQDRVELYFRDRTKPAQIILVARTAQNFGNSRPWLICSCRRRCVKLYCDSLGARCRICAELQFTSQRQWWTTRLRARADKIRSQLWVDASGKPARPYRMHRNTYRQHLTALASIEHAIRTGSRISSPRYRRYRERDADGRYCAEDDFADHLGAAS